MSLSRILSSGGLRKLSPLSTEVAHNPEALKMLDKELLRSSRSTGVASKVLPAYGKYVAKPAGAVGSAMYGRKMDGAKILATLGGTLGGVRYGGEAAKPMLTYLRQIGKDIAGPSASSSKFFSTTAPESVIDIVKPAVALTSKPLTFLDSALFNNALHMAENPLLASIALPFTVYGAARGGGALLSRMGRARRLSQLRKGIAPRAYVQQARQLGFK